MGGEASLCFAPSGVEANFWLPQKLVEWQLQESSPSKSPQASSLENSSAIPTQTLTEADDRAVLLVEDNMLIAIEMENQLKQFGFSTVDSAPTVDRAMKLLGRSTNPYQVCLLDINLKTENSFAIAERLLQTQTPFAFVSGYDSKHPVPDNLKDIPLLKKPVDVGKLSRMLQALLK